MHRLNRERSSPPPMLLVFYLRMLYADVRRVLPGRDLLVSCIACARPLDPMHTDSGEWEAVCTTTVSMAVQPTTAPRKCVRVTKIEGGKDTQMMGCPSFLLSQVGMDVHGWTVGALEVCVETQTISSSTCWFQLVFVC